jgi:hypothetical protein
MKTTQEIIQTLQLQSIHKLVVSSNINQQRVFLSYTRDTDVLAKLNYKMRLQRVITEPLSLTYIVMAEDGNLELRVSQFYQDSAFSTSLRWHKEKTTCVWVKVGEEYIVSYGDAKNNIANTIGNLFVSNPMCYYISNSQLESNFTKWSWINAVGDVREDMLGNSNIAYVCSTIKPISESTGVVVDCGQSCSDVTNLLSDYPCVC